MPTTNYRSENCTRKNGSSICWAENQSLESDRRLNASGRVLMRGSKTNHELDRPALRGLSEQPFCLWPRAALGAVSPLPTITCQKTWTRTYTQVRITIIFQSSFISRTNILWNSFCSSNFNVVCFQHPLFTCCKLKGPGGTSLCL